MYSDPNPTRVNYLKYADMTKLLDVVNNVRMFARKNPNSDVEDYIRQATEKIEDLFEGKVGSYEYVTIVRALRDLAMLVRTRNEAESYELVVDTTDAIIKLVQGDHKMDQNQLTAMTFRRVKEAIEEVVVGYGPIPAYINDESVTAAAEKYAQRIVADVFSGDIEGVGHHELEAKYVDKYYEMDPETEDVLDNGTRVIDGMKVLIEDPNLRQEIHEDMTASEISNARLRNRWVTVEQSRVRDDSLSFVGMGDDGVKRKFNLSIGNAWIVKIDSIPRIDTLMTNDGHYLDSMPTAKMTAYLKDRIKALPNFNSNDCKVQTGIDGDVVPLSKYLVDEDVIAGEHAE